MDKFKLQLRLLTDILEKKKITLSQILAITENQETLLKTTETDDLVDQLFNSMNDEKQVLIDEVINADNFFQKAFSEIGAEFEEKALSFKNEIESIQNLIKEVMDFDIKIRVQEQNNKSYAARSKVKKKQPRPTVSKDYMFNQYKKNSIPENLKHLRE